MLVEYVVIYNLNFICLIALGVIFIVIECLFLIWWLINTFQYYLFNGELIAIWLILQPYILLRLIANQLFAFRASLPVNTCSMHSVCFDFYKLRRVLLIRLELIILCATSKLFHRHDAFQDWAILWWLLLAVAGEVDGIHSWWMCIVSTSLLVLYRIRWYLLLQYRRSLLYRLLLIQIGRIPIVKVMLGLHLLDLYRCYIIFINDILVFRMQGG